MKPRQPIPRASKKRLKANGGKIPFSSIRKKPRKPREFKRIYGSKQRVEWVKGRDCWYYLNFGGFGCAGEIQNAHTVNGGMRRKADADTIIPLCASHHDLYDRHEPPFDTEYMRSTAKIHAKFYARDWLAFSGSTEIEGN